MRLLNLIFLLFFSAAKADQNSPNCDGQTNQEIQDCIQKRYEQADKHLNSAYRTAIKNLPADRKSRFIETQRIWIKYKEKRCDDISRQITPAREADIERGICLWKTTSDRTMEIQSIMQNSLNQQFRNTILALQNIGYDRDVILEQLRTRFKEEDYGWNTYAKKHCLLKKNLGTEEYEYCLARLSAQRGNY